MKKEKVNNGILPPLHKDEKTNLALEPDDGIHFTIQVTTNNKIRIKTGKYTFGVFSPDEAVKLFKDVLKQITHK